MTLDPKIKELLNKFADTQPALRLPEQPLEKSNIFLGDLLEQAVNAQNQEFTAGTVGDWDTSAPATIKEALDRLASAVQGLLSAPIP
jgi:hypothetical protein